MLFNSMQMVKKLDDSLLVLPGHYISWEEANKDLIFVLPLGEIKELNKNIYRIDNLDDFVTFIKNNMRKQPEEYTLIRLANGNFEQYEQDREEELDLGKNECAASAYAAAQAAKSEG
jgi:hypothetical protein